MEGGLRNDFVAALDAAYAKFGSEIPDLCRQAYDKLKEAFDAGDAFLYGQDNLHPGSTATAPIGGSWIGVARDKLTLLGENSELAAGVLFHEGFHMLGYNHGDLPGYYAESRPCSNGTLNWEV